ncbi:Monooxygenase 3 [Glycine soja]
MVTVIMETEEVVEDIVIVGAGIAGLTTSLGLHRHLNLISLLSLSLSHMIVTTLVTGTQTSVMPFTETGNQQRDREIRCVKRKLLLEALANELPSGTIRYLSKVVAIVESGFYKILHLADGTTIKNKVNNMEIFSQGLCRGSEQSQVRTQVPCDGKAGYWFFAWTPNSQDKELEDNPTKLKEYVLNTLEKMPSDVRYYIEKIKLDVFLLAPLGYRHPWELMFGNISKGNACVGGDAFHPMTPDLGQGGCCALEDGVVLSGCLAEAFSKPSTHIKENDKEANQYRRIEESLKKYANERRWRSIDVNATTYMVGYIQ